MSVFWQKYLSLWSGFVIVFGVVLSGAGFATTDGIALTLFQLYGAPPFTPDSMHRFSIGLMGAVTMGWGATFYVAFQALHRLSASDTAPLWRLMTGAVLLWYVVDSVISVATGIAFNAVSNTILVATYLIAVFSSGVMTAQAATGAAARA